MSAPPPPPRRARPSSPEPGAPGPAGPAPVVPAPVVPAPVGPPPRRPQPAYPDTSGAQAPRRTQVVVPPSPTRAQRQAQSGGRDSGGYNSGDYDSGSYDSESRSTGRGAGRRGGRRWGLIAAAIIAVVVIAAGAYLVLKPSSSGPSAPTFKASTAVDLQPGTVTGASTGFNGTVPAEVPGQVLTALGTYVEDGIVAPLRKGKADDAALAKVFDAAALAALVPPERGIVLDEGLPKAVGKVSVTTPAVPLTVLLDRDGTPVAVSADVQLAVTARAAKGVITISRQGSLVFAPDGAGGWKITGWTLSTERGGPGVTPAAAAASDTTTTTVAP